MMAHSIKLSCSASSLGMFHIAVHVKNQLATISVKPHNMNFHTSISSTPAHALSSQNRLCRKQTALQSSVLAAASSFTAQAEQMEIPTDDSSPTMRPLVKVCGVTSPDDAAMAAKAGADFIGMIIWPKARRSVGGSLAAEIAAAAREGGAEPVGVFVDEDADAVLEACQTATLSIAQLHGDGARSAAAALLASPLRLIYVVHADQTGVIQTPLPPIRQDESYFDWLLVDGLQGGSGHKFDWANLKLPPVLGQRGWILAGGLTPSNVGDAVALLRPTMVDVSSGVTMADKLRKDPDQVAAFITAAKSQSLTAMPL
eukprot:TRINITY_DN1022_c0_g1_i1.p1 TRINITY_DN1022_c0_g1~~TRINITY_DN1022_c0_g1_i1.p1  ORF type:complete len:314 (+),score=43.25 TRINITY_DN1022_c0_g1_i1:750-1691(+)